MLHVRDCYKIQKYGNLMNYPAYQFENFLQTIKSNIKMPRHIGQQFFNKFAERPLNFQKSKDFLKQNKQGEIISYRFKGFTFKTK